MPEVYNIKCIIDMGCLNQRSSPYRDQAPRYNANNTVQTTKIMQTPPIPPIKIQKSVFIIRPILPKQQPTPDKNAVLGVQIKPIINEFIEVKIPKDFQKWTQFVWTSQPRFFIPQTIQSQHYTYIQQRSFQQKLAWFRGNLQKKRISWSTEKSQYLLVDRTNILMSSGAQFQKINFLKQVKIVFKQQNETSDAGGLLRQWMTLCIKEIFDPQLGFMHLCDTSETFYKFNVNQSIMDFLEVAAKILGVVIGKAIFQRIPIQCPLNYTILRQICGQSVQMNDIFTYDKDFYNGWTFLATSTAGTTTMMEQNFCVYQFDEYKTQMTVPLKENGYNIMVDSSNRDEYLTLLSQYYCTKSISKLINCLKEGIYRIIPLELLQVFLPHQLDIIINGRKSINVQDLKENTIYTGYNQTDQVIIWFWEYVEKLDQDKLSKMLNFVTGNGRVPLLGFKYLQSNRGDYQKFHIKETVYDPINPYPKSHTCFNRLQLPKYPNFNIFLKYIEYITVEMIHFGLQ